MPFAGCGSLEATDNHSAKTILPLDRTRSRLAAISLRNILRDLSIHRLMNTDSLVRRRSVPQGGLKENSSARQCWYRIASRCQSRQGRSENSPARSVLGIGLRQGISPAGTAENSPARQCWVPDSTPILAIQSAVLNGFRDVPYCDVGLSAEIRNGSRNLENTIMRAGAKTLLLHCPLQQTLRFAG